MQGHEFIEALGALALVIGGLVLVPASIWAYRRQSSQPVLHDTSAVTDDGAVTLSRGAIVVAAALSLGAAIIHVAAVGPHMEEFPPFAYAFAALAVVQLVLGVALLRGWPFARSASVVISVGVIVVWVASRTVGLPFGPEPWTPEEIGAADVMPSIFEAALVAVLLLSRGRGISPVAAASRLAASIYVALIPVVGLIAVTTLIAVAALAPDAMGHMHG